MTDDDDFELIRGTGNVYADLGMKEPEQRQLRAILAAEISKTLATDNLTVRAAEKITGVAAADFSRIRQSQVEFIAICFRDFPANTLLQLFVVLGTFMR